MTSRFESAFQDRVIPAAQRAFGVSVVLHGDTDDTITARVELDELDVDPAGEGPGEQTGRLRVESADVAAAQAAKEVTIRGKRFHIIGEGDSFAGGMDFSIRRADSEANRSNIFDLNDEQANWT